MAGHHCSAAWAAGSNGSGQAAVCGLCVGCPERGPLRMRVRTLANVLMAPFPGKGWSAAVGSCCAERGVGGGLRRRREVKVCRVSHGRGRLQPAATGVRWRRGRGPGLGLVPACLIDGKECCPLPAAVGGRQPWTDGCCGGTWMGGGMQSKRRCWGGKTIGAGVRARAGGGRKGASRKMQRPRCPPHHMLPAVEESDDYSCGRGCCVGDALARVVKTQSRRAQVNCASGQHPSKAASATCESTACMLVPTAPGSRGQKHHHVRWHQGHRVKGTHTHNPSSRAHTTLMNR